MADIVISDADKYHFDTQGYVMLRGLIPPEKVAVYRDEIYRLEKQSYDDSFLTQPGVQGGAPTLQDDGTQRRLNGLPNISDVFDDLIDQPDMLARLRTFIDRPQLVNTWSISKDKGNDWGWWHAGIEPRGYHVSGGTIRTNMLNTIIFLTDNGPDDGCVVVVPGSHKANFSLPGIDYRNSMMPGGIRVTGQPGDVLMFTEALLHNGAKKTTEGTRTNLYFNFISYTYNVAMRELLNKGTGNLHHYRFGPEVRGRFNETQRELTEWMEWMRASPEACAQPVA